MKDLDEVLGSWFQPWTFGHLGSEPVDQGFSLWLSLELCLSNNTSLKKKSQRRRRTRRRRRRRIRRRKRGGGGGGRKGGEGEGGEGGKGEDIQNKEDPECWEQERQLQF